MQYGYNEWVKIKISFNYLEDLLLWKTIHLLIVLAR